MEIAQMNIILKNLKKNLRKMIVNVLFGCLRYFIEEQKVK